MNSDARGPQAAHGEIHATASTLRLVALYACFAALWILLSDKAVTWIFSDPEQIFFASAAKGWVFVAVTSLLLYGLVRRLLGQALASSLREQAARTDSLRYQKLLASIVDSSSDAIFAKDLEGRYLLANREIARVTGKDLAVSMGHDDTAFFPPEQAEMIRANDRRVIAENAIRTYEETLSTVDGQRTYLATKGPLYGVDGRVIGMFGISHDITERKRADTEMRKLSRAVEQSPVSIVITDREGDIEYVNPRFEQVTGYTRAEAIGRNPRILKSGDVREDTYAELWATIAAGGEWRGELCNRRKNGELYWEFAAISALKNERGEISHYVAVKEDITGQKAADLKIRRLSNLYAALSQCNRAVVRCSSEQELFEQICPAMVNYGGMKMAWISTVDPDSRRVTPVASYGDGTDYLQGIDISADPDLPSGRGPTGIAIRENRPYWCGDFLNDPATLHWRERGRLAGWRGSAAVPLRRNGVAVGTLTIYSSEVNAFDPAACDLVIEIAANVSFALDQFAREADRRLAERALRDSESRLTAIFRASPIGIRVSSMADGRILDINDAALNLYGFARSQVIGHTVTDLGFYAIPAQRKELYARLSAHRHVEMFEVDFLHSSGSTGKLELTGQVLELQGEQCLVAMLVDVTDRKRLEEVHLQSQKLESLGTMAAGIAHDFNNILSAIRGNAELAIEDVGPDHIARESLGEIGKASARASELVRRIVAFGRPWEAKLEVVELGPVVAEVLKLLRSTLSAGISLTQEFSQDTPHVLADAGQIHEAIVNLTTNAAYAIGPRPGTITYRLQAVDVDEKLARSIPGLAEGRYARLTVSDSGSGMDAARLERIFDAFYTTKPVGEGTGLGLSMVHGTMRSHAGAVTVQSTPGKGSSFALYFPAAEGKGPSDKHAAPAKMQAIGGSRVLYVDDEEALVFLASRALSRLGHHVSSFTDPQLALEDFRARPREFDIVVTDLSMPHMSGLEFAREVLALRPDMPVLMTSGYIRAEDEAEARSLGVRDLVLKPATMDELSSTLDWMFRGGNSRE